MMSDFDFDGMQNTMVREQEVVLQQLRLWEDQMRQSRGIEAPLNYADEFKPYGLLDRFYMLIKQDHPIDLRNVLRELLMQDSMATILNHIEVSEMKVRVQ